MSVIFQKRKIHIKTVLTIKLANIRGNGLFKWKLTNIGDISYDRHHFVLFLIFFFFFKCQKFVAPTNHLRFTFAGSTQDKFTPTV